MKTKEVDDDEKYSRYPASYPYHHSHSKTSKARGMEYNPTLLNYMNIMWLELQIY